MGALLRLADALDREHLQRVTSVEARVADGDLVLHIEGQGDLLLEQWALRRKSRMFTTVFGLDVTFMLVEPAAGPRVI